MSAYFTCFGCGKYVVCAQHVGDEFNKCKERLYRAGWRRRAFYESSWDKGPWFCCRECAYYSPAAKRAEKLAQEDFKKYCRELQIPNGVWVGIVFVVMLIAAFILKGCINASM